MPAGSWDENWIDPGTRDGSGADRYNAGMVAPSPSSVPCYLVRHGAVGEVVKASWSGDGLLNRGTSVVLQTHRGVVLGMVLEVVRPAQEPGTTEVPPSSEILRVASPEDLHQSRQSQARCRDDFDRWVSRIAEWGLDLQLIDLERTLDGEKVVLFVLNERGPECTKLALQAAAAGLGLIEVQPVSLEGVVAQPAAGGGCGSCSHH